VLDLNLLEEIFRISSEGVSETSVLCEGMQDIRTVGFCESVEGSPTIGSIEAAHLDENGEFIACTRIDEGIDCLFAMCSICTLVDRGSEILLSGAHGFYLDECASRILILT
jgi:hypothetical protein